MRPDELARTIAGEVELLADRCALRAKVDPHRYSWAGGHYPINAGIGNSQLHAQIVGIRLNLLALDKMVERNEWGDACHVPFSEGEECDVRQHR